MKNSGSFHIFAQNIDCAYLLEPPRRGGSNKYPQSMFLSRNKKINIYPCKHQWGLMGAKTILACFPDDESASSFHYFMYSVFILATFEFYSHRLRTGLSFDILPRFHTFEVSVFISRQAFIHINNYIMSQIQLQILLRMLNITPR